MKMLFNLTAPRVSWRLPGWAEATARQNSLEEAGGWTNSLPAWQTDWHEGRAREYRAVSVQQHGVLGAPDDLREPPHQNDQ